MDKIPKPIRDLAEKTLSNAANKFVDFVITRYTGKSIKVFEAEGNIEADKIITKWEKLEKPFWLEAEANKVIGQYTNLGNTLVKAAPLIKVPRNNLTEDSDLFWGLLEHSKDISSQEMQNLISKIIAGEYNVPGTYSMCTLQAIKMLGKNELELFERIGTLIINSDQIPQGIFTIPISVKEILKDISIDFGSLQTLQSLGLFLPNQMAINIQEWDEKEFMLTYMDESIKYLPTDSNIKEITLPSFYALSNTGKQIFQHLQPKKSDNYFIWLKENYKIPGFGIYLNQ
jgi:hypothetical protein